jgi:polyhydroxybutyrate depolymerase
MNPPRRRGRLRRTVLAVVLAAAVPAYAATGLLAGLQQTQAAIQKIQQQTQAALGKIIGQSGSALGATAQQSFNNLATVLRDANPNAVTPTSGTVSINGSITWQNQQRTYILIRPQTAVANAPALLLLHAHGMNSAGMANLAQAGRLARDYGVYVYLPQGVLNAWNDNPSSLLSTTDDVGFLSALADHAVAADGVDRRRIYTAGYSGGGFMAERLACQASAKIAGFVAVAATLRNSQMSLCATSHGMAAAFIDGTADTIVPYNGEIGLQSAAASAAFWAGKNACNASQISTVTLPNKVSDGTSIAVSSFTACPAQSAVSLYTVNGGGHTWPGNPSAAYTNLYLGKTSQNLDATLALWQFLTPYSLP